MHAVLSWSSRHRRAILGAAVAVALLGAFARRALRRDAIPDLSDAQIVLVADWMGHAAPEVAERITNVLTAALDGVAGATAVRGASMSGMSYVDVVFDAADRLADGRAEIVRRVDAARARRALPATARVQVGPLASSTGWVFEYALVDPERRSSLLELRRFQDDVLGPALAAVDGVAEVAPLGGAVRQLSVETSPDLLRARGLAFSDVLAALSGAHAAGAPTPDAIPQLPLGPPSSDGRQARLSDVAYARVTRDQPDGLADLGGAFRAVGGIVVARRDADVPSLLSEVRARLEALRARLPAGAQLVKVYDRGDLVRGVDETLGRAFAEETAAVVAVILIFLWHGRSALVPLVTLPLVLLGTFVAMRLLDVPATLMTLGGMGIALGIAVDADVVALEACHRRLESLPAGASPDARRGALVAAATAFTPAILTSLLITAVSFLPVFAFTGESGRLLRPLALAKTLVVASAALVSLTLAPALRAALLRGPVRPERDNPLNSALVRLYRPFVRFALRRPSVTVATGLLAVASCLPLLPRLGREFLPRVDEGDLLFMPTTLPGAPPTLVQNQLLGQDRAIASFEEVATVFGKVGRADTATDPAPYSMAETTIRLRPHGEWPARRGARGAAAGAPAPPRWVLALAWPERRPLTTAELVARLDRATRLPGWVGAWTTPARARLDMMATGFRTPVGLRIVAPTAERLDALGAAVREVLRRARDARSVVYEGLGGETRLGLALDAAALAAHEVRPSAARETADLLTSGGQIGEQSPGWPSAPGAPAAGAPRQRERRRRSAPRRHGARGRGRHRPTGAARPAGPAELRDRARDAAQRARRARRLRPRRARGGRRRGGLRGPRPARARRGARRELALGPGERIEWAGQYPLLAAGERRLAWIVPLVALTMLALLFLLFRSLTEALIVLVAVPFALVGSVWALFILGYPLSAPVWIGLLSVLGLAMQTGVVMVVYIDDAFHRRVRAGTLRDREDIVAAHAEGTVQRLRPKLMTVATMMAGLLPLMWADGPGAEVLRRVAAPMLGGLITSAFLTLEVLPVLYTIWRHHQLRRARRRGVPLEAIVGRAPAWARP